MYVYECVCDTNRACIFTGSLTNIFLKAKEFLSTHRFSLQQGDRKESKLVSVLIIFFFLLKDCEDKHLKLFAFITNFLEYFI